MTARRPLKLMVDRWWRFSRYQVRRCGGLPGRTRSTTGAIYQPEHFCIVPAPGAKLTAYQPWELWERAHPISPRRKTPYQELLDLLHDLRYQGHENDPSTPANNVVADLALTPQSEQRLLDWCAKWGLLGMLLHRVRAVTLAPHGQQWATLVGRRLPVQFQYIRTNDGWLGVPITSACLTPQVLIDPPLHTSDLRVRSEALGSTWARFFPQVPPDKAEKFPYPMPLSAEFWRMYGEPLWEFLDGAIALQQALAAVRITKAGSPATRKSERALLARGQSSLEKLERVSQASCLESPGGVRLRLVPASLLASFQAMALLDLKADGHGQIGLCPCGRFIFASVQHRAEYCSPRCRQRYKMRRLRAKRRTARDSRC